MREKIKERKIVSKCCGAEIRYNDGGYDGERIISVSSQCSSCGKFEPKRKWNIIGRPPKVESPF
jgi:hypothetical protein